MRIFLFFSCRYNTDRVRSFRFPLFTAIHRICIGEIKADKLIDSIRQHPEHM